MGVFQHFVLTRFNVRKAEWSKDKNGEEVLTRAWMDDRMSLFEQFCLPSIANQTSKNFTWLVFLDTNTSQEYQRRFQRYEVECKNLKTLYVVSVKESLDLSIRGFLRDDTRFIITTRIDNDDAFHARAIEAIQGEFAAQELAFVNLLKGYILDLGRGNVYREDEPSNPFISCIERINDDSFKTVLCDQHLALGKHGPVHQLEHRPYWLRVIHGRNLSNREKGRPASLEELREDFPHLEIP
jgi:hypothetical protein